MQKFGRNYKLTIQLDDEGTVLTMTYPLTLEFRILRATLSSSATASFRLYNLNPNHRKQIYKPLTTLSIRSIKLEAGYGTSLTTIFSGFVQEAKSYRAEGQVNFVTEISAYDYASAMPVKQSSWTTSAPNNTKAYVIRKICKDLELPIGAIGSFPGTYARNPSFCMPSWDALKLVTDNNCYIDNGKIYCLHPNEVVEGAIPVINSDSGLLGSPKINGVWVIFDMVFEPGIQVGQKVNLQSRTQAQWNGTYKVIGIEHQGSISGAISGKCKTTVTLMLGSASKTDPFILVHGEA